MSEAGQPHSGISEDLERFRNIRWLHNHWSRSMRRSYFWYLTFEDCPDLHSLARQCQDAISFPYYDLTPPRDLHLTLDRIAFDDDVSADVLPDITASAIRACQQMPTFDISVGPLSGTPGAIGFSASPAEQLKSLRDILRAATLSVYPEAPLRCDDFHAHIAIAYANSDDVSAADAVAAVDKINATARSDVRVKITHATLVVLERRPRSYAWDVLSRVPLAC
jgi:2'-5' RNA ligase